MGKKQHQKDKLYLTTEEWKNEWGGKKETSPANAKFRRLPFTHCALAFTPFENPYCTSDGTCYDLINILPFIKKYGVSPATGKPMSAKEIIKLNFYKNSDEKYHCPVTYKVFNENSYIVAIKTTGNVFSKEAVDQLNVKAKNMCDLLIDTPFTKADIITIQDPTNIDRHNLVNFYHLKNKLKVVEEDAGSSNLRLIDRATQDIIATMKSEYKPADNPVHIPRLQMRKKGDEISAAVYSTGAAAASFTSTTMGINTIVEAADAGDDVVRYTRVKKRAYCQLVTSCGPLNLELYADLTPRAAENFLKHCANNYYKDTIFHRLVKNFIIQGGDPTGTGTGGESAWGKPFEDEFVPNKLTHTSRGLLCMANAGPNTNKSQFFITLKSCKHLDKKHTIFGKVVGGGNTLDKMESRDVDKNDKPKEEVRILDCRVFADPFTDVDNEIAEERRVIALSKVVTGPAVKSDLVGKGVGKYMRKVEVAKLSSEAQPGTADEPSVKKKKIVRSDLEDFSGW